MADEYAKFEDVFHMFDKDGSGTICLEELAAVLKALGQNPTENELREMISEVDVDGNGEIDYPEFLLMMTKKVKNLDAEFEIKEAFRVFDLLNEGFIKNDDLKHILTTYGEKLSDDEVDEMLNVIDRDGDGQVTYEEFWKMIQAT